MSISSSVVTVKAVSQFPSTIQTVSFIRCILSIKRLQDQNLIILIGCTLYVFPCVFMYTDMWHACDKGMCALLSSCRIQLTFILISFLGNSCTSPRLAFPAQGFLSPHRTAVWQLGCSCGSWGELDSHR